MMTYEDFTGQPEFQEMLKEAEKLKGKVFSDIIDSEGRQYVDLVQEGGGVLGIALVGYTYILETAGIRFFNLAGTSAGAINTLVLAGIDSIEKSKSQQVLDVLARQDLFEFVDGDPVLKGIMQKVIDGTPIKKMWWKLLWNIKKIKKALFVNLGLNPGKAFEKWIEEVLKESPNQITTIGQLKEKRDKKHFPGGLKHRVSGDPLTDEMARIHIIAADVTTQTKVLFPEMGHLYWGDKMNEVSPAKMVRASMSVPFFFIPLEIGNLPGSGEPASNEWQQLANYHGHIPDKVKFVDGGMISNFPINVFHFKPGAIPRKPTFGVKLSSYRQECAEVDDFGSFAGAMISTMRHDADNEFLIQNPDFEKLICFIDADKDFNWLNFKMSDQKKKKLFLLGARKGLEFIQKFDWENYKKIRAKR
ncbi:NTE family protein [Tangfeifania diversioriginum]|uniref:NTE family protein n=1 Tax=Tangfeifania diversioriginum TaxID=1168035 RepID=A0A1M6KVU9_9BACT|nr:patatin-like phospholipase family protein [Tangfeifania diversioriginum]SHJ63097.1 NTE family protein [Tangfeifania diversioriginum]